MIAAPAGCIAPAPHLTVLRRTIRFILIISLIPILLTAASRAAAATTITVTAADDTVADNGQCSLREAAANADHDNQSGSVDCPAGSGADTIVLSPDIITLAAQLNTSSDITITSPGGTDNAIQAGNCNPITAPGCSPATFRVLEVSSGSLTLTSLTIRNGSCTAPCDGGGLLVDPGAALTLDATTVTANRASAGGGISNNGTLIVRNGSAIFFNMVNAGGGGLANVGGTASLSHATVAGNLADTGGGIASYSTLNIDSSHIDNNQSAGMGGGLSLQHGAVTITNSRLSGNSSGGLGSVVAADDFDTFSLTNSCITGNSGTAIQNNLGSPALNATNNWWGGPAGPTTPSVTTTYGDTVGANVDVSNFKTTLPAGCTSISPYASLSLTPGFPDQLVNTTSAPKAITLTNVGLNVLNISKVLVTGPYALTANSCDGQNLSSGGTCAFALTFSPIGVGAQPGGLVIAANADGGPQVYTISGKGLTPAAPPALKSPKNGAPVYKPPRLAWKAVKGAPGYHVEIDDNADFSSLEQFGDATKANFPTTRLPFGIYFWHVSIKESFAQGAYSAPFSFEVTLNKAPKKNAILKNGILAFKWQAVKGKSYTLRITDENAHAVYFLSTSPLTKPSYKFDKAAPIPSGDYSWQVSIDGGGTWTPPWKFHVN